MNRAAKLAGFLEGHNLSEKCLNRRQKETKTHMHKCNYCNKTTVRHLQYCEYMWVKVCV